MPPRHATAHPIGSCLPGNPELFRDGGCAPKGFYQLAVAGFCVVHGETMTRNVSERKPPVCSHSSWRASRLPADSLPERMARPSKAKTQKNPVWLEQGERLAATRAALGFSSAKVLREALADHLDIGESAIRNYESGTREITPAFATALCERLGLTLDWIYRGIPTALPQGIYSQIAKAARSRPAPEPLANAQKRATSG